MNISTINRTLMVAAISTAIAGGAAVSNNAHADGAKEKCYGVAKAGKNDCANGQNSCAGSATVDGQGDAFIVLSKGICEKLVGGSTEPKK